MYLSFGLALTIPYFYTIESAAFELQVSPNITVSEWTTLNWTWRSGDPENIAVTRVEDYNGNNGGCPANLNATKDVVIWKINLGEPDASGTRRGSELFKLNSTGQIKLCAYSYEKGQNRWPKTITLLTNSTLITVDPPSTNSTSQPTVIITSILPGPATNAPSDSKNSGTSKAGVAPGVIAGAVLGGSSVTFCLVVGIIGCYMYRRKRKQIQRQSLPSEPTLFPYPNIREYNNSAPTLTERKANRQDGTVEEEPQVHENPTPSTQLEGTSNENSNHWGGQRERRILYHDDSGWRPTPPRAPSHSDGGTSNSVLEMPPGYDAAL